SIASIFKVEKNTLIGRVPNALNEKSKVAPVIDYEVNNLSLRQKKERYLTKIMMMNPDLLKEFSDDLSKDILTFKPYYDIIRGLCVYFKDEKNTLNGRVLNALNEKSKVATVIDYEVNNLSLRQKKERYLTKIMMMNPDLLKEFSDDLSKDILTFKPYYDIIRGLCVYFQ